MKWVSLLADTATVAIAVAVFAILGMGVVGGPSAPMSAEFDGVRLDGVSVGIDFAGAERTLVAVLRSDCPFCERSKPFYRRLAAREREDVQFVIAAPPGDMDIESYRPVLEPDSIVFIERGTLPVLGTPTLLLVDREGAVEAAWTGQLSPDQEGEVLAAVFSG